MSWLTVTYRVRAAPEHLDAIATAIALEQSVEVPAEVIRDRFIAENIVGRVEEAAARLQRRARRRRWSHGDTARSHSDCPHRRPAAHLEQAGRAVSSEDDPLVGHERLVDRGHEGEVRERPDAEGSH